MMKRILLLSLLALSACGALLDNLNGPVAPTGGVEIQVLSSRGLGTVAPDLTAQVVSYRLTVGSDVRTGLIVGDLASQSGYAPGTFTLQLEALNAGGLVIMTHPADSVTITSGSNTPKTINLAGTQLGAGSAKVRFNLGVLGLGAVSKGEIRWANTVAGLASATPTDLGAPLNDTVEDYIEYANASLPSGISYLQFRFYGFNDAGGVGAPFAYSPLLTLVIYDNAESALGYSISTGELDGRPTAPTNPIAPLLLLSSAPHNGNYLQLNWTDTSLVESGYRIYRKLAADLNYPATPLAELGPNITTWEEISPQPAVTNYTSLVRGELYTYKIVAYTSVYPQGSALEVTTPALEPKMTLYTGPNAFLSWGSVFDVSAPGVMGIFTDSATPKTYTMALSNEGLWPLSITSIDFTGATSTDYSLGTPDTFFDYDWVLADTGPARSSQGYPQSVEAGGVVFVRFNWHPTASGIRTSGFQVTADDMALGGGTGVANVDLQGESLIIDDYTGWWKIEDPLFLSYGTSPNFNLSDRASPANAMKLFGAIGSLGTTGRTKDRFNAPDAAFLFDSSSADALVIPASTYTLNNGFAFVFWAGGVEIPDFPATEAFTLINTFSTAIDDTTPLGASQGFALELMTHSVGSPEYRLRFAGNSTPVVVNYAGELNHKWNQVALTYTYDSVTPANSQVKLIINGTTVLTANTVLNYTSTTDIGMGARSFDSGSYFNNWKGPLDDIRLYSRPLSDLELSTLFAQGSYVWDNTPSANPLAVTVTRATVGTIYLNWDLSNLAPGEAEGVVVSVQKTNVPVGSVFVYNYPAVVPGGEQGIPASGVLGDEFTVIVKVKDNNYNLSTGTTLPVITIADSGMVPSSGNLEFFPYALWIGGSLDNGATYLPLDGKGGTGDLIRKSDLVISGGGKLMFRMESTPVNPTMANYRWFLDGIPRESGAGYGDAFVLAGDLSAGPHQVFLEIQVNGRWYSTRAIFTVVE